MEVRRDVQDLLAVIHALRIAQIPQIIPAEDALALLAVHHAQHIAETLPIIQEGDAPDPHVAQTVTELVQLTAQIIVETVVHQTVEKDVPILVELVADANAIGRVVVHVTSNVRLVV